MARGNQRDLAREKNLKKQQDRKKAANEKNANRGMSLEQRKQRDADLMRQKQKKAVDEKTSK